jgi:hypothetical protein
MISAAEKDAALSSADEIAPRTQIPNRECHRQLATVLRDDLVEAELAALISDCSQNGLFGFAGLTHGCPFWIKICESTGL